MPQSIADKSKAKKLGGKDGNVFYYVKFLKDEGMWPTNNGTNIVFNLTIYKAQKVRGYITKNLDVIMNGTPYYKL